MSAIAYKLVDAAEWDQAVVRGVYEGSDVDLADGYIHMSTADQLAGTARKHYRDRRALRLITVDLDGLGDALRWEPSRGGALFPHLHGPLPVSAARDIRGLNVDADGLMRFDDGTAGWP